MKIRIHEQMLAEDVWFPFLDVIVKFLESDRHGLDTERLDRVMKSKWLMSRPQSDRDLVKSAAVKRSNDRLRDASVLYIDPHAKGQIIFDVKNSLTTVAPIEALHLLSTPFQIVVENEFNDGAFMLWVAKAVGNTHFIEAYRRGFFSFRHAGGKHTIARCALAFSQGIWVRRSSTSPRNLTMFLAAILDSDAKFDGDHPNSQIVDDVLPCVAYVHCLNKRTIENYIPATFILKRMKSLPGAASKCKAFDGLSRQQRAYFNMKSGFRIKEMEVQSKANFLDFDDVHPAVRELYRGLAEPNWNLLAEGFGRDLCEIFSVEELRPNWNDSDFSDPDDRREITDMLNALIRLF